MSTLVKIHRKGQITLPSRLRSALGVADGDIVEAKLWRGKILITPRTAIDRSQFPNADDEYTPEQRRIIDTRLAKSEEDLRNGRPYGPFNTADEMIAHMKGELKKGPANRSKRSR